MKTFIAILSFVNVVLAVVNGNVSAVLGWGSAMFGWAAAAIATREAEHWKWMAWFDQRQRDRGER